jgi:pimeloyl-ACP methyl ester carboxylesterase
MNAFASNYLEFLDDQITPTNFDKKVLVIAGERSSYIDHRGADEFARIFPKFNSKENLKWIPNAGHLVHFE